MFLRAKLGRKKPKGTTVAASLATLARWKWDALEAFGAPFDLLICDECHHVPAQTWIRVVCALPCRWRMGLTATPERKDGLHTWMHLALGRTVYRIDQSTLDSAGRTMAPEILELRTFHQVEVDDVPARTMRGILEDPERNGFIRGAVERLASQGRTILVLTGLVDHAKFLAGALEGEARGEVTAKRREAVLARVRSGSSGGRHPLATKGDLPGGRRGSGRSNLPQSSHPATGGRACRRSEGKRNAGGGRGG